ncbi:DNA protecting protein DprA [Acididesulfobacillus acetoxydans]|uniref:DNA protecting protein DprA n=1 Tax=Acididesulfobacillus acetoxydans TaxID=1561005 RepID=A0A8S0WHB3_9FIRM|nr:DNA-processing protein DprA [Acididesulfobacillus acetoxydans]CAA7602562.1 DNA protecting protein DprA [Acididesulfobacillus acetoxydans]CEJ07292.1 Protein smf [Acididesulfobacillus acetoxydans]
MENLEREKRFRAALRAVPGLGSRRLRQLIAVFGSAEAAWQAPARAFTDWKAAWVSEMLDLRKKILPERVAEELDRAGIRLVAPAERSYPKLLAELADAPPLLYFKGHLSEGQEGLAIVGSRRGTPYGKAAAEFLARKVAERGIVIVSGLARGIDTSAHKGALAADGVTWAFLGNGLDTIYPPENRKLAEAVLEKGALVSEFTPGTPPDGGHFPARNRLISGACRGVVVIEAAAKSGALITADFALEQGREVFALPGPIFSEMSKGTNHLLRQGARIVDEVDDIWAEIPVWQKGGGAGREPGRGPQFAARREAACCGSAPGKSAANRQSALVQLELNIDEPGDAKGRGAPHVSAAGREEGRGALGRGCSKGRGPGGAVDPAQAEILEQMSDLPIHIDQLACRVKMAVQELPLLLLELQLAGVIEQLPGQLYVLARKI